jgi:hypothetical protein
VLYAWVTHWGHRWRTESHPTITPKSLARANGYSAGHQHFLGKKLHRCAPRRRQGRPSPRKEMTLWVSAETAPQPPEVKERCPPPTAPAPGSPHRAPRPDPARSSPAHRPPRPSARPPAGPGEGDGTRGPRFPAPPSPGPRGNAGSSPRSQGSAAPRLGSRVRGPPQPRGFGRAPPA